MALERQTQVIQGLDELAGKALRKTAKRYRKGVVDPLIKAVTGTKGFASMKRALSAGLAAKMKTDDVAEAFGDVMTQSAAIGAVQEAID